MNIPYKDNFWMLLGGCERWVLRSWMFWKLDVMILDDLILIQFLMLRFWMLRFWMLRFWTLQILPMKAILDVP